MFKTIGETVSAEIVEKKSKFIATVFYVESAEEAEERIKELKKKYFDARHNCYAYSIFSKDGIVQRFSDDGEPQGTAGSPMLNIITSQNLNNIVVIVTRYFGGILLGTGGLVRAYSDALKKALDNSKIIQKDLGLEACLEVAYPDLEKLKYYLKQNEIRIVDSEYLENIKLKIETTNEKLNKIKSNENELGFHIMNIEIIREKYIEI